MSPADLSWSSSWSPPDHGLDWPRTWVDVGHTQPSSLPRPSSVGCSVDQAYLCDVLSAQPMKCPGYVASAPGSWPSDQAMVAMAMPYPWTVSWAPQATGMSQKYHPSGKHPNRLSQTAALNSSNRKILSERVLILSLETRWPPWQSLPSALLYPFSSSY